jgi:hypothetical protein
MGITFKAKLKAGIKYDKHANVYVTFTPALGIYSQGESAQQAKRALEDAVKSFLFVSYKKGVLAKLIKSADFCEKEYIRIQETILKENSYRKIFEVPASLQLSPVAIA